MKMPKLQGNGNVTTPHPVIVFCFGFYCALLLLKERDFLQWVKVKGSNYSLGFFQERDAVLGQ